MSASDVKAVILELKGLWSIKVTFKCVFTNKSLPHTHRRCVNASVAQIKFSGSLFTCLPTCSRELVWVIVGGMWRLHSLVVAEPATLHWNQVY